jgi:5-methylcytosine-specific restriction endonuclease McrA
MGKDLHRPVVTVKRRLYKKYKGTCQYCRIAYDFKFMTVDHIRPLSLGGGKSIRNMTLACWLCNQLKDRSEPIHHKKCVQLFVSWLKGERNIHPEAKVR